MKVSQRYEAVLSSSLRPDILTIVDYFKDKEPINPHAVNPDYLKLTEAEESKLND